MSLALLAAWRLIAAAPEGGMTAIQENAIASLRAETRTDHATLTVVL